jgi:hypothetical protein
VDRLSTCISIHYIELLNAKGTKYWNRCVLLSRFFIHIIQSIRQIDRDRHAFVIADQQRVMTYDARCVSLFECILFRLLQLKLHGFAKSVPEIHNVDMEGLSPPYNHGVVITWRNYERARLLLLDLNWTSTLDFSIAKFVHGHLVVTSNEQEARPLVEWRETLEKIQHIMNL